LELKHRGADEVRIVPSPPELTAILREHLNEHGTTADGRLFRGVRGGPLSESLYGRVWAAARAAALTPEEVASPLARRPYDLRHAAVSTWLNATGDPTRVAEWAGHSVNVLLRVYAKCIAGQTMPCAVGWRRRYERGLEDRSVNGPWTVVTGRTRSDNTGHTRTAPDRRFRWSGAVTPGVAGEGFEPS
jgi:integrase